MGQFDYVPESELLEQFPDFDEAWGTAWGEMWAVAHVVRNSGMMDSCMEQAINGVFDALDAILKHYDNDTEQVEHEPTPSLS